MGKIINAKTGEVTEIEEGEPYVPTADDIRFHRDALLAITDWRFRVDMTPSQEWVDYCQALRDIPQQAGFPESVVWPIKP